MNPELYEEELAALRAERNELRERLAASEKLTAAYEQQERIACQVNVELTELLTATEKAATDFRARVEAELEKMRTNLTDTLSSRPADEYERQYDAATRAAISEIDAAHKQLTGEAK